MHDFGFRYELKGNFPGSLCRFVVMWTIFDKIKKVPSPLPNLTSETHRETIGSAVIAINGANTSLFFCRLSLFLFP